MYSRICDFTLSKESSSSLMMISGENAGNKREKREFSLCSLQKRIRQLLHPVPRS